MEESAEGKGGEVGGGLGTHKAVGAVRAVRAVGAESRSKFCAQPAHLICSADGGVQYGPTCGLKTTDQDINLEHAVLTGL